MFAEPAESNINVLDQMTVTDMTDQEALDDFLNSPDVAVGSSQSGWSMLAACGAGPF